MAEPADIVVGAVLVDNLVHADGSRRENIPGGAGLYALAGAALFGERAVLVAGVGEDVDLTFGSWLDRNGLDRDGLRIGAAQSPRNILRYTDDHTRTETPVYGHEHFRRLEPTAADLGRVLDGARSLYVFRNTDQGFWDGVLALSGRHDAPVLWEIALDACAPRELPRIEAILSHIDAFSLNLDEARLIFGPLAEDELVARLGALPVGTVFLRAGARGSYAIARERAVFVPSLDIEAVDVTGGGNAYCGAAAVGLGRGLPPVMAAAMGTVAASLAIAQFGPPEPGDPALRDHAREAASRLAKSLAEDTIS